MDNLRWMVIILLIPYHAAQAFNVWGELNYIIFSPNKAISSFIVFLSPYYMPLMFLLAGISARYALKKRSYGQFIVERIKRLLVPFVFGTLFFCPIMAYMGDKCNFGYNGGFFAHYKIFFTKWTDLSGFDGGFGVGQFWFLYFLFVISLVAIGIIALAKRFFKEKSSKRTMPYGIICLFVVPLPFLYDLLSVGGKSFAEYLYIFLLGYYVFSNDEVIDKMAKYRYISLPIGLLAAIIDVYMFIWSGKDFGTANVIAKAFAEWFMLLSLIGIGKNAFDRKGRISTYLSERSLLFFAIHFIWVIMFQYWFSFLGNASTALLYLVPVILAYIATFVCCEICYHIPVLCFLMGSKYGSKREK